MLGGERDLMSTKTRALTVHVTASTYIPVLEKAVNEYVNEMPKLESMSSGNMNPQGFGTPVYEYVRTVQAPLVSLLADFLRFGDWRCVRVFCTVMSLSLMLFCVLYVTAKETPSMVVAAGKVKLKNLQKPINKI